MAETNAAVSTKSQEESQKAFKERLLKIMGADATEAYLKAYGFDEGNAFARNYDGTLPAEGEEPAFFTNIDEQGNVLFLDEDRALRKSSFPGKPLKLQRISTSDSYLITLPGRRYTELFVRFRRQFQPNANSDIQDESNWPL